MILEADKPQDLQLASWRPRMASGIAPTWILVDWRPRKSWCFSLSPEAGKNCRPLKQSGSWSSFLLSLFILFRSSLDVTHPHCRGHSASLSTVIQMLISSWNTLPDTPRTFNQMSGLLVAPVKLIHKINHFTPFTCPSPRRAERDWDTAAWVTHNLPLSMQSCYRYGILVLLFLSFYQGT